MDSQDASMSEESTEKSLSSLFDDALIAYESVSNCDQPTNSSEIQYKIKKCMSQFEDCTRMVSLANIFSSNEHIDEIATENIKYFLLPVLLGNLTQKISHGDRLELIEMADVYFKDFMKRCKAYSITDVDIEEDNEAASTAVSLLSIGGPANKMPFDMGAMARTRAQKIARYKEQKDLDQEIESLNKLIKKNKENNLSIDDEILRNYYIKLIKSNISKCIDEIDCLTTEKQFVKFKKDNPDASNLDLKKIPPKTKSFTPIIITKNDLQKKVFGAGYPSLPMYTVQEFYEQRVNDGIWKAPDENNTKCLQKITPETEAEQIEKENEEKEKLIEMDDNNEINRARAMDEFKDDHKRGYGNTYNRS